MAPNQVHATPAKNSSDVGEHVEHAVQHGCVEIASHTHHDAREQHLDRARVAATADLQELDARASRERRETLTFRRSSSCSRRTDDSPRRGGPRNGSNGFSQRNKQPHKRMHCDAGWWTRLQPIRTLAQAPLEFAIFTHEAFRFQEIDADVRRMRRLGMSLRAIGRALGVDEKTVRKVLRLGRR